MRQSVRVCFERVVLIRRTRLNEDPTGLGDLPNANIPAGYLIEVIDELFGLLCRRNMRRVADGQLAITRQADDEILGCAADHLPSFVVWVGSAAQRSSVCERQAQGSALC